MKRILLLPLLFLMGFMSTFAQQSAVYSRSIRLNDGDVFNSISYNEENFPDYKKAEQQLASQLTDKLVNSSYLRAFDIANSRSSVEGYVKWALGSGYVMDISDLQSPMSNMISRVFDKPAVRDYLFDLGCSVLVDMCKLYPKDFKEKLLKQIAYVDDTVKRLSTHTYIYDNKTGNLYVDGKLNDEICWTFDGIIIRRYVLDKMKWSDMRQKIATLRNKITATDVSKNPDIMGRVVFNDEASYKITASGNYYIVGRSRRLSIGKPNTYVGCQYMGTQNTSVKCLKDMNNVLYVIYSGHGGTSSTNKVVDLKGNVLSGDD